jgi:hypothetical protein
MERSQLVGGYDIRGFLLLWSRGQSSWLQIQRSGFESRYYKIFWEVCLEPGLENREYGLGIRHADHVTPSTANVGTNFADNEAVARSV